MSNSVLDDSPNVTNKGVYWEEEKDPQDRGRAAWSSFKNIEDEQATWRHHSLTHIRMYRNIEMMGYSTRSSTQPLMVEKVPLSLNVVRNMANAVHSRITRNQVKAQYQTKGGDWEAKKRARKLEAYGTALALKEKLHRKTPYSFIDCLITGTGVVKTYIKGNAVTFDRIFSPNLVVDFAEGSDVTLTPAHYYEVKYPSKHLLMRRYPDMRDEIEKLPTASAGDGDTFYALQESDSTDRVRVIECLFLNADDPNQGTISIVAEGGIELKGGPWTDGDPYSVMRWSTSNLGWYGMGLAEELKGIQSEINKLLRKIANAMSLLGNPYVLADRASNIQRGQITDIPGSIILYNGKVPIVSAAQTVHPEMFQQLDRLYTRAYEISGISSLSAHGEKPGGLESGRSLLVYDDIQDSDRFATMHREWSNLHVDAIEKGIKCSSHIKGYSVPIYGRRSYDTLTAKDLDIGKDDWVMFPMPASLLGDTPAGQIQNIMNLAKQGLISNVDDLLEQMLTPDQASYLKRATSPKRLIEDIVGEILYEGNYISPEPALNLALAMDISQLMYIEAKLDKCPEDRLKMLRQWQDQVRWLLKKAAGNSPPSIGAIPSPTGNAPQLPPAPPPGADNPAQSPPSQLMQ